MSSFFKVPAEAICLNNLYNCIRECNEKENRSFFKDYLLSRFLYSPTTVLVAPVTAFSFAAEGVLKAGVKILSHDPIAALKEFLNGTLNTCICVALTVANIADVIFGPFIGNFAYKCAPKVEAPQCQPEPQPQPEPKKPSDDEIVKESHKLLNALGAAKQQLLESEQTIQQLKQDLQTKDGEIRSLNTNIGQKVDELTKTSSSDKEKQNALTELKTQLDTISQQKNQQIQQLNSDIRTLEGINKNLQNQDQSSKTEIKQLKQQISDYVKQIELKNSEIQSMIDVVRNISLQKEDSDATVAALIDVNRTLREEIEKLRIPTNSNPNLADSSNLADFLAISPSDSVILPVQQGALAAITNGVMGAVNGVTNYVAAKLTDFFVDGNAPWKKERYDWTFKQLINRFGRDELENLKTQAFTKQNDLGIVGAIDTLFKYEEAEDAYLHYQTFQTVIRNVLRELKSNPNAIDIKIKTGFLHLCQIWFEELNMDQFYSRIVHDIAAKGGTKTEDEAFQKLSLAEKLSGLMIGIMAAPAQYKNCGKDVITSKIETIRPTFDPLMESNIPNQLATYVYKDATGAEKEIVHMRTGVPIGPQNANTPNHAAYVLDGVELVPEYVAFLDELKRDGKKLLVVLHLNPKFVFQVGSPYNVSTLQKQKEGHWIKLYQKLAESDEYKDVIDLSVLPMDVEWVEGIEHHQTQESDTFVKTLLDNVINDQRLILPLNEDERKEVLTRIVNDVRKVYFEDAPNLTKEMQFAFVGQFYSRLIEELSLLKGSSVVQRNCKDAIDRTMAIFAGDLCDKLARTEELTKDKHEMLSGIILGPALGVMKRELLFSRAPLMHHTVEYTEQFVDAGKEVSYPAASGYTFARVEFAK